MKLNFLEKINIRLVLIHCLSGVLLIFVSALLGNISDIELINLAEEKGFKEAMKLVDANRLTLFQLWYVYSTLIGLLVATIISIIFFIKRKLIWLNSLFVFIALFVTNYFGLIRNYRRHLAFLLDFGLVINVVILSSILTILAFGLYYYSYRISKNIIS